MKGATNQFKNMLSIVICFNPRSHEGSDGNPLLVLRVLYGFNPRSHEGSDKEEYDTRKAESVSIHAPMKGATLVREGVDNYGRFQSTLP